MRGGGEKIRKQREKEKGGRERQRADRQRERETDRQKVKGWNRDGGTKDIHAQTHNEKLYRAIRKWQNWPTPQKANET